MALDRQQTFDTACAAIIKQGRQSVTPDCCVYRGPDGTKCAIGWLIPDASYEARFDNPAEPVCPNGFSKAAGRLRNVLGIRGPLSPDADFLTKLQRCHDEALSGSEFVSDFKRRARAFAERHDLSASVLDHRVSA